MAPARCETGTRYTRFPRPRGDGPITDHLKRETLKVPPPARGWPHTRCSHLCAAAGSPARAGMALTGAQFVALAPRFPRPRGDGPGVKAAAKRAKLVPPPARGWPPDDYQRRPVRGGSPARAGMALRFGSTPSRSARFPRPRGDGPLVQRADLFAAGVPPPARGWLPLPGTPPVPEGSAVVNAYGHATMRATSLF